MKIAYVRVSTVDQSLESQVKAIHNKFGTDVKIVEEYGVSGTINGSERPELSKLLGMSLVYARVMSSLCGGLTVLVVTITMLGKCLRCFLSVVLY